jgi:hypothetical protein
MFLVELACAKLSGGAMGVSMQDVPDVCHTRMAAGAVCRSHGEGAATKGCWAKLVCADMLCSCSLHLNAAAGAICQHYLTSEHQHGVIDKRGNVAAARCGLRFAVDLQLTPGEVLQAGVCRARGNMVSHNINSNC